MQFILRKEIRRLRSMNWCSNWFWKLKMLDFPIRSDMISIFIFWNESGLANTQIIVMPLKWLPGSFQIMSWKRLCRSSDSDEIDGIGREALSSWKDNLWRCCHLNLSVHSVRHLYIRWWSIIVSSISIRSNAAKTKALWIMKWSRHSNPMSFT